MFAISRSMVWLLPGLMLACAGEAAPEASRHDVGASDDSQGAVPSGKSVAPLERQRRQAVAHARVGTETPQMEEQSTLSQEQLHEESIRLAQERLEARARATAETLELPAHGADEMVAILLANLAARTALSEHREAHGGLTMNQLIERAEAGDSELEDLLEAAHPAALNSSLQRSMGSDRYSRYVALRRAKFESSRAASAPGRTVSKIANTQQRCPESTFHRTRARSCACCSTVSNWSLRRIAHRPCRWWGACT